MLMWQEFSEWIKFFPLTAKWNSILQVWEIRTVTKTLDYSESTLEIETHYGGSTILVTDYKKTVVRNGVVKINSVKWMLQKSVSNWRKMLTYES